MTEAFCIPGTPCLDITTLCNLHDPVLISLKAAWQCGQVTIPWPYYHHQDVWCPIKLISVFKRLCTVVWCSWPWYLCFINFLFFIEWQISNSVKSIFPLLFTWLCTYYCLAGPFWVSILFYQEAMLVWKKKTFNGTLVDSNGLPRS